MNFCLKFISFFWFYILALSCWSAIPAPTDPSKINFALNDPEQLLKKPNQVLDQVVEQLEKRTSMRLYHSPAHVVTPENLYQFPILLVPVCHQSLIQIFPQIKFLAEIKNFVEAGGTILFFECAQGTMILEDIQKELTQILGKNNPLERIFKTHAIYRSFYLVKENVGCKYKEEFLYGYDLSGRTAIIYFKNDLLNLTADNCGAGGGSAHGNGSQSQTPEMAYRTFTNLFMYALTLDYKLDQVHLPEILNKRY